MLKPCVPEKYALVRVCTASNRGAAAVAHDFSRFQGNGHCACSSKLGNESDKEN